MEPKIVLMDPAQYDYLLLERAKRHKRGKKNSSRLVGRKKLPKR